MGKTAKIGEMSHGNKKASSNIVSERRYSQEAMPCKIYPKHKSINPSFKFFDFHFLYSFASFGGFPASSKKFSICVSPLKGKKPSFEIKNAPMISRNISVDVIKEGFIIN
jgi:hypothetical protein